MGLCLGTCSISIKTQTKSTASWLCSIALVIGCSVPSHPMVVVMSSCHRCHRAMVNIPPPPPPRCSSSSPCHLLVVYPVVVMSCHTPSLLCCTRHCRVVPVIVVLYPSLSCCTRHCRVVPCHRCVIPCHRCVIPCHRRVIPHHCRVVLYPIVVISYHVVSCHCCCIRCHWYALHRWALSLWHLLSRRGGPSSSLLFPEAGLAVEGSAIHYMCRQWVDGTRASLSGGLALGGSSQLDGIHEGIRKRTTTFIVVHFHDALHGPPIPWVPPCVSPTPIPPLSELELPTSLWKGEGWM